jgi:hypothetical protein
LNQIKPLLKLILKKRFNLPLKLSFNLLSLLLKLRNLLLKLPKPIPETQAGAFA